MYTLSEVIFSIKGNWNFHHNALTSVVSRFVDFEGLEPEKHYHLFPFFRNIITKKNCGNVVGNLSFMIRIRFMLQYEEGILPGKNTI